MRLSIVIPARDEERMLPRTLEAVARRCHLGPPHEVLVADCASTDATATVARAAGARVVAVPPGPPGRAHPLNVGATVASGTVLMFLDADTLPPEGFDRSIRDALDDPEILGGAFELAFDGPQWRLRLVELVDRIRYRVRHSFYGDQGLFVRTEAFHRVGGYPEQGLFEAADLCRRLRRHGRLTLVRDPVLTSPRRFVEGGILRVFAQDIGLWLLHFLGLPTERFGPGYWRRSAGPADPPAG